MAVISLITISKMKEMLFLHSYDLMKDRQSQEITQTKSLLPYVLGAKYDYSTVEIGMKYINYEKTAIYKTIWPAVNFLLSNTNSSY